jgi:glycyl-tRNA synthetase
MFLTFLCDAYREEVINEGGKTDVRVVLGLDPRIAPVKVAVLPLSKKPELSEVSWRVYNELSEDRDVQYDEAGSIGKRYRRQDEIGTPLCVTIDFDSLSDQKVTVRHRDTMKQERISMDQLSEYVSSSLKSFKG